MFDQSKISIKGAWGRKEIPGNGILRDVDIFESHIPSDYPEEKNRMSVSIYGNAGKIQLCQDNPGLYPVHYVWHKNNLYFHERKFSLKRILHSLSGKPSHKGIKTLSGGEVLTYFNDKLNGIRVLSDSMLETGINKRISNYSIACREFKKVLLSATEEIYNHLGKGVVAVGLSGGVDSALTLWALKEIGADVVAITAGVSEYIFDAVYAEEYAKDLGVDWHLVKFPFSDEELQELVNMAIFHSENSEFSNTLMAMGNYLVREKMESLGIKYVFNGFGGDYALGSNLSTPTSYLSNCKQSGTEPTDEGWSSARTSKSWHQVPSLLTLSKVFRTNGCEWRSLFLHPSVFYFLTHLPLSVTPVTTKKHKYLYYKLLDGVFKKNSWADVSKVTKVGYYTSCGIGKVRLVNPILQDINLRRVYFNIVNNLIR
jgi:asparagine synthetase B (glutamine-hydrolysing)